MLYFFKRDPLLKLMLEEPHISPEELGRITDEVVILAGSRDVIREDHTRAIHAAVPGSRLEILEGCTHGSYVVHSTEIAGLILKYCGKS